jgi:torulene dioxygenase
MNPAYQTRRHRYSYRYANRFKSSFMDGIVKFNNVTQTSIFWEEEGHTPGEAIFVADPEGKKEDDGVLLTVVLDGFSERSYLLVLSAKDLSEVGRAEMAGLMSFGFHGAWKAGARGYRVDARADRVAGRPPNQHAHHYKNEAAAPRTIAIIARFFGRVMD